MAAAAAAAADALWGASAAEGSTAGLGSSTSARRSAATTSKDEEPTFETSGDGSGPQTWVNPAYEKRARPAMDGAEFVVEKSKFAEPDQAEDFEALRQELLEEEMVGPSKTLSLDDPLAEEDGSDTDESSDDIELGEVRGSDVPVRRPRYFPNRTLGGPKVSPQNAAARMPWQSPLKARSAAPPERKDATVVVEATTPPSTAPAATPAPTAAPVAAAPALALQAHDAGKFLLLGGLPLSLSRERLRELSEEFGKVNRLRMLDDVDNPRKSTGIALVEFYSAESAARAADPRSGYRMQNEWLVTFVPPPKVVLVSRELLGMMFAGVPPWPEGGYCSEDLRAVLLRQFELWELGTNRPSEGGRFALSRRDSNSTLARSTQGYKLPAEDWKSKLRALKRSVNSRQDMDGVKRRRL